MSDFALDPRLVAYLKEARETELALVRALRSHLAQAPRGIRRDRLMQDLDEARQHLAFVERRLLQLGIRASRRSNIAHSLRGVGMAIKTAFKRFRYALRPPLAEDVLLENAKHDVAIAGRSIANYFALESLARRLGDRETADIALEIRSDKEDMLEAQRREIPELAVAAVRAEVAELSFDMSLTGGWWAYEEVSEEQVREALARVQPPSEDASHN